MPTSDRRRMQNRIAQRKFREKHAIMKQQAAIRAQRAAQRQSSYQYVRSTSTTPIPPRRAESCLVEPTHPIQLHQSHLERAQSFPAFHGLTTQQSDFGGLVPTTPYELSLYELGLDIPQPIKSEQDLRNFSCSPQPIYPNTPQWKLRNEVLHTISQTGRSRTNSLSSQESDCVSRESSTSPLAFYNTSFTAPHITTNTNKLPTNNCDSYIYNTNTPSLPLMEPDLNCFADWTSLNSMPQQQQPTYIYQEPLIYGSVEHGAYINNTPMASASWEIDPMLSCSSHMDSLFAPNIYNGIYASVY